MGDSSGAGKAAAKTASQGPGVFKRLLELMVMLISAILVAFAWDTAGKAQEESAQLRQELRMARAGQGERTGTRCTVCLDNPREILIQPCGHVVTIIIIHSTSHLMSNLIFYQCICSDCSQMIATTGNQCPICRQKITATQKAYIS